MALTEADLVRSVRIELDEYAWQDYLSTAFNTGDITMEVDSPEEWAQGDTGEADDDTGEQFLVKSDGVAATPVQVRRGFNGTTPVDHAINTPVRKSPRWPYQAIAAAIAREVPRLWPSAWLEGGPTSITPVTGVRWYPLPATAMDLIGVSQITGTALDFVAYGAYPGPPVAFEPRHPSLAAPAIGFPQGFYSSANPVKVSWRKKALVAADVEDGLMAEVVVAGSCARLLSAEDTERTGEQTNIGSDVAAGARLSDASWYEKQHDTRLFELNLQLLRDRPPMGRWRV